MRGRREAGHILGRTQQTRHRARRGSRPDAKPPPASPIQPYPQQPGPAAGRPSAAPPLPPPRPPRRQPLRTHAWRATRPTGSGRGGRQVEQGATEMTLTGRQPRPRAEKGAVVSARGCSRPTPPRRARRLLTRHLGRQPRLWTGTGPDTGRQPRRARRAVTGSQATVALPVPFVSSMPLSV